MQWKEVVRNGVCICSDRTAGQAFASALSMGPMGVDSDQRRRL